MRIVYLFKMAIRSLNICFDLNARYKAQNQQLERLRRLGIVTQLPRNFFSIRSKRPKIDIYFDCKLLKNKARKSDSVK